MIAERPSEATMEARRNLLVTLLHDQGSHCVHWQTGAMCERWADTILASDWLAAHDAQVRADRDRDWQVAIERLADEWDACDEQGNPLREGSLGEAADELRALAMVRNLRRIADQAFDPFVLGGVRALHDAADEVGGKYTTAAWLRDRANRLRALAPDVAGEGQEEGT